MTSILSIDTATDHCSVALSYDHSHAQQLLSRTHQGAREHTARVLPMVNELLSAAKLSLTELDAIAVTTGPGSFTGLRIGVSIAQGLAYSADLPIISLDTLEVMVRTFTRESQVDNKVIIALLDARMGDLTWASYKIDDKGLLSVLKPSSLSSVEQLKSYIGGLEDKVDCIGSGCQLLQDLDLKQAIGLYPQVHPDASAMIDLAKTQFNKGDFVGAVDASPDYFRTEISWQKRQFIRQTKA